MVSVHDSVRLELARWDIDVFEAFAERFEAEIETIASSVASAYDDWQAFDGTLQGNLHRANISALIFGALSLHTTSTKLLIWGYLVQSGNTMRQVLETVSMAFLASDPELCFLERYSEGKYSTNHAVRDVIRYADRLNLNKDSLETLRRGRDFYGQLSHPTLMTLGTLISLRGDDSYFGGSFDDAKTEMYKKELSTRVQVAGLFTNMIAGIRHNLGDGDAL